MITKEKIFSKGEIHHSKYELSLRFKDYHQQFEIETDFMIFFINNKEGKVNISNEMLDIINFHSKINPDLLNLFREESYKHYRECIKSTDYGMVSQELIKKHNGNIEFANLEYFNIQSDHDIIPHMKPCEILITEKKSKKNNELYIYSNFQFNVPWEKEHGIHFHFKNMEIIEIV